MTVYTLFGQASNGINPADPTSYTMGVQFKVTTTGNTLTGIWFYSGSWAAALPNLIELWQSTGAGTGTKIHSETPSWSGAAGSGWVRAAFASPPALTSGTIYKAAVSQPGNVAWYAITANYWSSGAGSAGITNGPLTAPNNAGSVDGQDCFNAATDTYPATAFNASNYWVDPEITSSTDFTASPVSLALAPMALGGAGAAGIEDATTLGLAPMALAAGALTGGNVTASAVSLALAPMGLAGRQAAGGGGGADYHHMRRRRRW